MDIIQRAVSPEQAGEYVGRALYAAMRRDFPVSAEIYATVLAGLLSNPAVLPTMTPQQKERR